LKRGRLNGGKKKTPTEKLSPRAKKRFVNSAGQIGETKEGEGERLGNTNSNQNKSEKSKPGRGVRTKKTSLTVIEAKKRKLRELHHQEAKRQHKYQESMTHWANVVTAFLVRLVERRGRGGVP